MDDAISSAYAEYKNIIILGNIDLLGKHPHQDSWSSVIENYELSQLITNYTRVTPTKQSLLDHIYVSDTSLVKYSDVLPWALSDHFPVYVVFSHAKIANKRNVKHIEILYRNTKNYVRNLFVMILLKHYFPNQFSELENDVNGAVNLWTKVLIQINNNHCPRVTKRIKRQKQPNWITNEIVNIMRRRNFEKKRHNNAEYKKLRNKCKLMIRNSKTTFYKETIHK